MCAGLDKYYGNFKKQGYNEHSFLNLSLSGAYRVLLRFFIAVPDYDSVGINEHADRKKLFTLIAVRLFVSLYAWFLCSIAWCLCVHFDCICDVACVGREAQCLGSCPRRRAASFHAAGAQRRRVSLSLTSSCVDCAYSCCSLTSLPCSSRPTSARAPSHSRVPTASSAAALAPSPRGADLDAELPRAPVCLLCVVCFIVVC